MRFEHDAASGATLDETIREVAAADRGVLPLLSFLLDQLWQRRSERGFLTFAAYRELGGLEGAIGRRAEDVFQAQPEVVKRELIPLLRELVTIESGKPISRTAPLSRISKGSSTRALIDAFLDPGARLVVSDGAQLRLAHEALLSHWPRAKEQIGADARDLELRGRLERDAEAWRAAKSRHEKRGRVISGLPLAEARALVARWGVALPAEIREFVAASRRAVRCKWARLAAILTGAVLGFPVALVLFWVGATWWGVRQVETEMKFVHIPAGCFEMGSPDSEAGRYPDEGPVHKVCLKAFDLAQYEVTQGEWRRVIHDTPSYFGGNDRLPVDTVSWYDAQTFIRWMSFFGRYRYRLPSEAEYEYAARAGTTTPYYWGDQLDDGCTHENISDQSLRKKSPDLLKVFANCDDGYTGTAPVGSFRPNPWGLYDMLGNVGEWIDDCYIDNYRETPTDGSPNRRGSCKFRVVRGGAWYSPRPGRAAARYNIEPTLRNYVLGFRVVRIVRP